MSRIRFVTRVAAVLAALVLLTIAIVITLFNSETFTRWIVDTAAQRSEGTLQIGAVSGSLGTGLRLASVDVELDSANVAASEVELQLDWRSLVARSLIVDYLNIRQLDVELVESNAPTQDVDPYELSWLVLIRELSVDVLNVAAQGSQHSLSQTSLELRLLRNRLELNDIGSAYQELSLNGNAILTLAEELDIDASVCLNGVAAEEQFIGCIDALGTMPQLQVEAQFRQPFSIAGRGSVILADNGELDFEAAWENAAFSRLEDLSSRDGTIRVSGSINSPRIETQGSLSYADQLAQFTMHAALNESDIDVELLQLTQAGAVVQLTGSLGASFDSGVFALEFANVDPQQWLAEWPGSIDGSAGLLLTLQPRVAVAISDVAARGALRGRPVAALGNLDYTDDVLTIDGLQVVSRTDRISVDGEVADELSLDVEANISDLAAFAGNLGGALTADLNVSGSAQRPAISGAVSLTNLRADQVSAESLRIAGDIGLAVDDPVQLSVSAAAASVAGTPVRSALVIVEGTGGQHRVDAQLAGEAWSTRLAGSGALANSGDWSGAIEELEFRPQDLGLWQLRVPAQVSFGRSGYAVSQLCLDYELSGICAALSVASTPEDSLNIFAVNFDVGILQPFMPEGIRAKGLVNASANLSGFGSQLRGDISVDTQDAQLDLAMGDDFDLEIPIVRFGLGALLDDAGATVSVSLDAAEVGDLSAAFVFDEPLQDDSPIRGSVNVQWHDASVLSALSPDVDGLAGRLDAGLSIGGTADAPLFSGSAGWSQGRLEVPTWGLAVEEIEASFEADESREAIFRADGLVDSTPVELDGTALLDPEQGWPMELRLIGQELMLIQLADLEMRVSPDLYATVNLPEIEVSGGVVIPYARIRDVALPEQAVLPSADTTVHGQIVEEEQRPLSVSARIILELGEDVTYEDANLSATATGRLNLDYLSGQGASVRGALSLSGEYDAYGNPLVLRRGQLVFVGPADNPSLDILAVREIGEVTAGVQLTGTLQSPATSVFSDPVMSEADALGWLVFGRPLDGTRETDSDTLRNAALSMGLQQALPIIERIGESLRLDDFAIRSTEADAGALMAGKYFSPNLYFRYSYGLFNRIGGLLLRYRINDRFSLETRSGEHNSMDLLYTVEKD